MGFMDKLRAELVDVIEWIDDSRHTLVWRFPRYHNQIKSGAKLIVRPGQAAVFVHEGKTADVFYPGTYTLDTSNLPILSTLQAWPHGFDSPFKAEVYFITTRQITGLKWGTPNPVIVRDPDYGPVRVRAFGAFTLKAVDPRALLEELVGTDGVFETEEIMVLLRSIVSSAFADLVARSGFSVPDLASRYNELGDELKRMSNEKVDDEYGLQFPQMFIVNISVPEEVEQALDARSGMAVVDDLNAYQSYQMGRSMPVAAENPAGGLAAAGVGLGMGMAYVNTAGPGDSPQGPMAVVPPAPPEPQWHVSREGETLGPVPLSELRSDAAQGKLTPETWVWRAGMSEWVRASEAPELKDAFDRTPPPPPAN